VYDHDGLRPPNGSNGGGFLPGDGEGRPSPPLVRLSDVLDGEEADCFAALVVRERRMTNTGKPFLKCTFRDRRVKLESMVWSDHRLFQQAQGWTEGMFFRLRVRGEMHAKYGMQVVLLDARPAGGPDDDADGFDVGDLVESTDRSIAELWKTLHVYIEKWVDDPFVKTLVTQVLAANKDLFQRMQAASSFHHSYTGGLLEHVWSMTRIASFVADHYAKYYPNLNPPLNRSVVVAAVVLHDIGKLRELEYHPVEAKYTKEGCLIGHVLLGRDMVREAARQIDGFPEETLLLLEHAILAHHGKREFGAPILPQTIEALIVSFIDDLDAKVNVVARELQKDGGLDSQFTSKLYALDNRRMYRGVPLESSSGEDEGSCG
jgi:3'-5' exoribonuclease